MTDRDTEARRGWRHYAPVAIVLGVGLTLSITVFLGVRHLEDANTQAVFAQQASLIAASLEQSIDQGLDDVHSVADFFTAAGRVDDERFRSFATPMLRRRPALQSLKWVQRLPGSARSAYEAEVRAAHPGFEIFERDDHGQRVRAQERPEHFVAHYRASLFEPNDRKVLGFDLNSEAMQRDAMARARDTGRLVATGRSATLSSGGQEFAIYAFAPVYGAGPLDTVEARRANLVGFGQAALNINRLVKASLHSLDLHAIDVVLLDESANRQERLLYDHGASTAPKRGAEVWDERATRAGLHISTTMSVGERRWELLFYPARGYHPTGHTRRGLDVLGAGLLATAAMVAYSLSAARATRNAQLVALRTSELAAANDVLTHEIAERKAAEESAVQALEAARRADEAKSRFLATMSHEIRTPMNGVIGMTALLVDTELNTEQHEYAETIRRSGEALLAIINDILDFSKIEAGKLDLDQVPFALRDTLGEVLKTVAPLAHGKGLELAYDVQPDVPDDLLGDPGRLGQILLNLVSNAIKFTERGEVTLHVDTVAPSDGEVALHIAVRDTGIGIASDKLAVIFEAFAQADSSTTRRYGGTGLGLPIACRLAELMGGRIWVESAVGHGSAFHVTLRLARATAPTPRPAVVSRDTLRGLPVLVVDDNDINRRFLRALLTSWGMKPTVAGSATTALAALTGARSTADAFRLVLLDAHMPEGDGFSVVERMRDDPTLADVTIMLLTSDLRSGELRRCRELGIMRYLVKPITPSELLDAVLTTLGEPPETAVTTPAGRGPATEPRRSLRVLVAEDNRVNQLVISHLLERLNHAAVVCGDGREAVAAVQRQPWDLVLMDVQMPEMDGLAATAAIRRHEAEQPGTRRTPIVALTAFAMKGDRERCLAAGMDGYLAKPVRRDDLRAVLARLCPDGDTDLDERESAAEARAESSGWSVSAGLAFTDGDRELLSELLAIFVEDGPGYLRELSEDIACGDAEKVMRAAHTLKGELRTLGAAAPASRAEQLEALGRSGRLEDATTLLASLTSEVDQLLVSAARELSARPPGQRPAPLHGSR